MMDAEVADKIASC